MNFLYLVGVPWDQVPQRVQLACRKVRATEHRLPSQFWRACFTNKHDAREFAKANKTTLVRESKHGELWHYELLEDYTE